MTLHDSKSAYYAIVNNGVSRKSIDLSGIALIDNIPGLYPAPIYLGRGQWQSVEFVKEKQEAAVFIFPDYYRPIIKMINYSILDNNLVENESTFVESLAYLYADDNLTASHHFVTSINGSDSRGNAFSYKYEITSGSPPVGKTTITGRFLVCQWKDCYVMETINYQSTFPINSSSLPDYQSTIIYHLHTPNGVKELNRDSWLDYFFGKNLLIGQGPVTPLILPKEAIFCSFLANSLRYYEDSFSIYTWSFVGSRAWVERITGSHYIPYVVERINEICLKHNLVGNKIYKIIYEGNTPISMPHIEILDITKEGLIKPSRRLRARPLKIKNNGNILAMSYHP
ncbi:hypothetical protein LC605_20710 [Nostoc sp. CHAB 5836]|uniref:hypothetical protein n=1 Tax=Nostoc sp. CHAB 5836 TaxID=2780404 RepID=UPI001E479855|nr:hypothetical protein [Nostoc sp. CHAB 5836]MCC5617463.1 hypothetical protein [Nostoc sp. CHAB 5836]